MSLISQPRSPCPTERAWDELAAGLTRGEEAEILLEHASWCETCAACLRAAIEIFAQDEAASVTPAGPQVVSSLEIRQRNKRHQWPLFLAAAALLAVIFGAGYLYWRRSHTVDPITVLARAYTAHRTLELRLPGAAHGEMRVERGAGPRSLAEQPEELLDVATRVRKGLARNANDPLWLWARGRLAILEDRPDEAIRSLEAALDWGPSSPDLLTDLAISYWQRGKHQNAAVDLNHAVEILGRALQANPNHQAALFDRAVIEEELHEMAPAVADLEKLLSIEPSGPWSEETRQRLARLRGKKARFFDRGPDQDAKRFDEIALDGVLRQGLSGSPADLSALAVRFKVGHHDHWLADLLQVSKTPQTRQSIRVLARMTTIRLTVESGRYRQERAAFDALSKTQLPAPLAAWYAVEAIYRATRARGEFQCPVSSEALFIRLKAYSYYWSLSQLLREQGTCSEQGGDMDGAEQYANRSIAAASQHGFPVAAARARALLVNVYRRRGQYREALSFANSALEEIYEEQLPVSRSHEFYNIIMGTLEALGWWHSALSSAVSLTEVALAAGFRDLQFTNTVRWAQFGAPVR
jgi:tetratricopeptide (TPR) repeat protein